MKKYLLLLIFAFTSFISFSQISNYPNADLSGDDILLIGDNQNGSVKNAKTTIDSLKKVFNIFRTKYGNVSKPDSNAILHGLELQNDTTFINNSLVVRNGESVFNIRESGDVQLWYNRSDFLNKATFQQRFKNGGHSAEMIVAGATKGSWGRAAAIQFDYLYGTENPVLFDKTIAEIKVTGNSINADGSYNRYDSIPAMGILNIGVGYGIKNGQAVSGGDWNFTSYHRDSTNMYVSKSFNIYQKNWYDGNANTSANTHGTKVFSVTGSETNINNTLNANAGINISDFAKLEILTSYPSSPENGMIICYQDGALLVMKVYLNNAWITIASN